MSVQEFQAFSHVSKGNGYVWEEKSVVLPSQGEIEGEGRGGEGWRGVEEGGWKGRFHHVINCMYACKYVSCQHIKESFLLVL